MKKKFVSDFEKESDCYKVVAKEVVVVVVEVILVV